MKKEKKNVIVTNYSRIDVPYSVILKITESIFNATQQTRFSLLIKQIYPYTNRNLFVIDNYNYEWRNLYDNKKLWLSDPIVAWQGKNAPASRVEWDDGFFSNSMELYKYGEEHGFKYGVSYIIKTISGHECILSLSNELSDITIQQMESCEKKYLNIYTLIMNECRSYLLSGNRLDVKMPKLSEREKFIIMLIADGYTSLEIAKKLFVTESTVNFHIYNITNKMGCRNRYQIIAKAISQGLI